ncbi:hypothetical protein U1Q18_007928 [Sarracenia purpurea var. burkii]
MSLPFQFRDGDASGSSFASILTKRSRTVFDFDARSLDRMLIFPIRSVGRAAALRVRKDSFVFCRPIVCDVRPRLWLLRAGSFARYGVGLVDLNALLGRAHQSDWSATCVESLGRSPPFWFVHADLFAEGTTKVGVDWDPPRRGFTLSNVRVALPNFEGMCYSVMYWGSSVRPDSKS